MTKKTARRIRTAGGVLFLIYMILLIYLLFFAESYGRARGLEEYHYNLVPFREIRRYLCYPEVLGTYAVVTNLAGNVIGFLPFGVILPVLKRNLRSFWKILLLSFELSGMIEVTQLLTRVGSFDVDDIILNTLGGVLGYGIFSACNHLRRKYYG